VDETQKDASKKPNNLSVDFNDKILDGQRGARRLYSSSIRNADFATSPQVSAGLRDTRHSLANTDVKNLRASGGALSQKGIELNFHRRQVAKGQSQVNTDSLKLQ
jgi:hypothetical protein